jgi:hypothetical protein
MPHLELERLAALDHDAPSAEELAHLATCLACRREQEAFAQLADLAGLQATAPARLDVPRLTEWEFLSTALRAEGLLASSPPLASRRAVTPWWARTAAAALLLVCGVAAGRMSAGVALLPSESGPLITTAAVSAEREFGSVAEASAVLDRAQRDYERASFWLASHDTTVNAQSVYRARLAALEQMLTASRDGLYEAPQDPVLNQYYLSAYTAREATLRQLGAALPVDRVMESF